ncbi:STAS domain-containing protein [Schlegelella sp. S2-27]|uniref:STAS domain-containing protein n=1 Tax=Caldimonas mangrovi TaxID=2944811 RepID=A0ABT0YXQ1_9BURK|nr:STAS domain-containing protein [Caldimonas mangrovi]MCM5682951.1 STAS domain-containing protein [Caldimonas mangrovi]
MSRHVSTEVLRLDGELTICRAAELKPVLLDALQRASTLEIDLSSVSEMDSTGVQLLMLVKRHALSTGRELNLTGHSKPVVEVFELLDLAAFFGDPLVIPANAAAAAL